MKRIVIVGYRPKPGRSAALEQLIARHVPRLRSLGLATARPAICMTAADGTVIEVFEWVSQEALQSAHQHDDVLGMWAEFAEVCDYIPVAAIPEAADLFSEFSAIEPDRVSGRG